MPTRGDLHHLELWVPDLGRATTTLGWLLERLGHTRTDTWPDGASWSSGDTYVVLESGPDTVDGPHERRRPGLNHIAFHAGTRQDVDDLTAAAQEHGWTLLFPDRHPHAGGPDHYASYLEDADGFEVELVASG